MTKSDDVNYQTHLQRRGSTYYFRVKIPADLLSFYHPKQEIKFSLKTKDRREAVRLANEFSVRHDREFENKRRLKSATQTPERILHELDDETIDEICKQFRYSQMDCAEFTQENGLSRDCPEYFAPDQNAFALLRKEFATGNLESLRGPLEAYLQALHINIDFCPLESKNRLLSRFFRAFLQAGDYKMRLWDGDVPDITSTDVQKEIKMQFPAPAAQISGKKDAITLQSLFEDWNAAVPNRAHQTLLDTKAAIKTFLTCTNNKPANEVQRADFNAFRDHSLKTDKLKPKTVEKKLALLCAIFQFAVDNEKLPSNPASRIKVPKPKTGDLPRQPFDEHDLKKLFSCAVYTAKLRPRAGGGEAAAWLPLLALFTGARLEELGQLRFKDISDSYIDITDAGDNQLKNESSRRKIPIHPALIERWLPTLCSGHQDFQRRRQDISTT